MRINWVIANAATLDPVIDVAQLKNLGSIWGSWTTWRNFETDNVVCHDIAKIRELIAREFHHRCNFYIPNAAYQNVGRPDRVRLYEGTFLHDVDNRDEIVSMHLAAGQSDVILLMGYDLQSQTHTDKLMQHRRFNYENLVRTAIQQTPAVQWVLIDHVGTAAKEFGTLPNLGFDSLTNILS
jgi:hypothetical protein